MHKPVMLSEVMSLLNLQPGELVVDGTVGMGGHALAMAERIAPNGTLIALDRDSSMLERAQERLRSVSIPQHFVHADYRDLPEVLDELGYPEVDAVLIDMGICSDQLDDPERGLAFRYDAPLDMRLDREQTTTAFHLLQKIKLGELTQILREYGGERWAGPIAKAILRRRDRGQMNTTGDLVAAVMEAIPRKFQDRRIHPATRTFQAIRIAVNRELDDLEPAFVAIAQRLRLGGRMAVLAYHSLEDRAVKQAFRQLATPVADLVGAVNGRGGANAPASYQVLTPKPIEPTEAEIGENPRARSAKLRVLRRTG
ncbi:MAG: 16S rRNA (cytosine(1402)-N(4))-methyltransferase RsmH [Fimbriimonadales bacterium]